jgi:NAD(P) transhydrogenase subunit alpha
MYARTVAALIQEFAADGAFRIDLNDEIQQSAVVTHSGQIVNARVRSARGLPEAEAPTSAPAPTTHPQTTE